MSSGDLLTNNEDEKTNGGGTYPGTMTSNADGLKAIQGDRYPEMLACGSVILLALFLIYRFVIIGV